MKSLYSRLARDEVYLPFVRTISSGCKSNEAIDRSAEQKMTFVDDTNQFQYSSMPIPHGSIWEK